MSIDLESKLCDVFNESLLYRNLAKVLCDYWGLEGDRAVEVMSYIVKNDINVHIYLAYVKLKGYSKKDVPFQVEKYKKKEKQL